MAIVPDRFHDTPECRIEFRTLGRTDIGRRGIGAVPSINEDAAPPSSVPGAALLPTVAGTRQVPRPPRVARQPGRSGRPSSPS